MIKVTVELGSARPGGLDVSIAGLLGQTFQDFEVIFVDARYHQRHERVLDYVKKSGLKQPFYHVPNHRYNGKWYCPVSGINTGFALAEGEITILLMDYAYAPPNWIEDHVKAIGNQKRLTIGPYYAYHPPAVVTKDKTKPKEYISNINNHDHSFEELSKQRENFDEISIFEKEFVASDIYNSVCLDNVGWPQLDFEGPLNANAMATKNNAFLTQSIIDINGMDEHYDNQLGPGDAEMALRLQSTGNVIWGTPYPKLLYYLVRPILPKQTYSLPTNRDGCDVCIALKEDNFTDWADGEKYYFNNMSKWKANKGRASNPFDIKDLRKELWNWRERSQEREPVIPRNSISNRDYWKESLLKAS